MSIIQSVSSSAMIDWVSIVRHSHRRLSSYWYSSPVKGGRKRRKRPPASADGDGQQAEGAEGAKNGGHKHSPCGGDPCSKSAGNSPAGFSGGDTHYSGGGGGGGICSEPYESSSREVRKYVSRLRVSVQRGS